jgi:hypothetical protein
VLIGFERRNAADRFSGSFREGAELSTQISKDVSCPHCGAAVKTQMWPGISAGENPELREKILDETLFDWECPKCGYKARFVYPCLYHDKDKKFMIYVVPNGNDSALQSVDISEAFPQFKELTKRVVTTPTELKEKILILEAGLNDLAVELVKVALIDVAEKKHGKSVSSGYFCDTDEQAGKIGFSFFLKGATEPVRQETRMDVYRKSLEISESVGFSDGGEFMAVDSRTARDVLRKYRGEED